MIVKPYGFHMLKDGRLLFFSSIHKNLVRKRHKEAKREGWVGGRYSLAPNVSKIRVKQVSNKYLVIKTIKYQEKLKESEDLIEQV